MTTTNEPDPVVAGVLDGSIQVVPTVLVVDVLGGGYKDSGFTFCAMREADPTEMAGLGWLQADPTRIVLEEMAARLGAIAAATDDHMLTRRVAGWRLRIGEMMGRG